MKKQYLNEMEAPFTPMLVMREASRCLLCLDAPCSQACPAETDPAKFIRSVLFKNFKGAAEVIRENNALGATCARVCPTEKLCQLGCTRSGIDHPIDIGRIQRFVTDFEMQTNMSILPKGKKNQGKVAIIGSGPAGLQASVTLSHLGYDVTIYEKNPQIGGWLRSGIPSYRLPESVLDHEIAQIKNIGINFVVNTEIGKDISLAQLKQQYSAVLLAIGNSAGRQLPLFENNSHVEIAVDFLAKTKQQQGEITLPTSVLVIGGGDVAMDVATTLKVLGVPSVTCVAREELTDFPASKQEFAHALAENVSIIDGFTPVSVTENNVTFEHVRSKATLSISAEKIILAIGQIAQLETFKELSSHSNTVHTQHYQTSDPQIFAAGDIMQGDKTVVYAVKLGKEAAHAIHHSLKGGTSC